MHCRACAVAVALVVWASYTAYAAHQPGPEAASTDWPQWLGPNRNGISTERVWLKVWPADGPTVLWEASVGLGYASVAVANGRAYTLGHDGGKDTVFCFDAETGEQIWTHSYSCRKGGYPGPRATPTVSGECVYALSREGHLFCLTTANGSVVWQTDVRQSVKAAVPRWGFAGSPLVEGKLVILNVGTAGAAFDRQTGDVVWTTGPDTAGYASPVIVAAGRKRAVAMFTATAIVVLEAETGELVWKRPWHTTWDVNAATPIIVGDRMFLSTNYGTGCALLKIGGGVIWQNENMENHFNNSIHWKGYLYGFDDDTLKCLDFTTGEEHWSHEGLGKGSLTIAGGFLLVMGAEGDLLVARASPKAFRPVARARVLDGHCWTIPVLSGGRIYCRNKEGTVKCLDVQIR